MNIAIISSTKDKASTNIKEHLLNSFDFKLIEEKFDGNEVFQFIKNNDQESINNENNKKMKINNENLIKNKKNNEIKLYTINTWLINREDLDKEIDADVFVFISKHTASDEKPSLTIHSIGNFGKAEHGGKEKTLCKTMPSFMKNIFNEINKNNDGKYEVTMESTHHGPFLDKAALFVEIGSIEEQWKDKDAAGIIAKSVMDGLKEDKEYESIFVVGGSHYNYIANKVMLKSDYAAGHICAKYNLETLDIEMIKQAMEKSNSKFVLLDWKGLGKEKKRIVELLGKDKIEFKRSDKFFDK